MSTITMGEGRNEYSRAKDFDEEQQAYRAGASMDIAS